MVKNLRRKIERKNMFIVNVNLHLVNKRNEGSINVTCTNAAKKKKEKKKAMVLPSAASIKKGNIDLTCPIHKLCSSFYLPLI